MKINPFQGTASVMDVRPEDLAGDKELTPRQKIVEASRQFEAILLRQVLSETQKTVIPSEFTDNSTASSIYQDMITNTLANDISKSGTFGLAKIFEQQLSPPPDTNSKSSQKPALSSEATPVHQTKHPISVFTKKP